MTTGLSLASVISFLISALVLFAAPQALAADPYCLATDHRCERGGKEAEAEAALPPNTSEDSLLGFTLNPSAVPVRDAIGLAGIYYKIRPNFLFVKGTGRVGAAISPSNGDDTFFGNPSLETDADYLYRRQEEIPFEQMKVALGMAASIFDNDGNGFNRFHLTLGMLGRYIGESEKVIPGGGVTLGLGPLSIGGGLLMDETLVGTRGTPEATRVAGQNSSITAGLTIGSLMLDYTRLTSKPEWGNERIVDLASVNLLFGRLMISGAYRKETSDRKGYDAKTRSLIAKPEKEEAFAAVQYTVFSFLQVGAFYNYFLLHEVSAGATLFF